MLRYIKAEGLKLMRHVDTRLQHFFSVNSSVNKQEILSCSLEIHTCFLLKIINCLKLLQFKSRMENECQ